MQPGNNDISANMWAPNHFLKVQYYYTERFSFQHMVSGEMYLNLSSQTIH